MEQKGQNGYTSPDEIVAAISRIKDGDTELLWRLVEPHQRSLRITAYSLLRNMDDAAEVVQETMLKALTHLHQLRNGECFRSWLMRIAVNEARMRMRRVEYCNEHCNKDAMNDPEEFIPRDYADWRDIPSNALEQKEIWDAVHHALQSINPRCREVFVLRDLQHFAVPETAKILAVSEAEVSLSLHRARLQMRELLAPLFRSPCSPWVPLQMIADLPITLVHRTVSRSTAINELSGYIEGELSSAVRAQIEAGLKSCSQCKILLDRKRKLLYLVADKKAFLPPFVCSRNTLQAFRGVDKPAFRVKKSKPPRPDSKSLKY